MSVQSVHFHARWDNTNNHLQDPIPTAVQKIGRVVYNIFSVLIPIIGLVRLMGYAIQSLANRAILPAAYDVTEAELAKAKNEFNAFWTGPITAENKSAREKFAMEEHTVVTPDAAALSVKLLRHKNADKRTPTVIYFNGNFAIAMRDPNPWFLQKSIEIGNPCNFVFFDYRGVADSTGTFRAAKDLLVDGSSIVQWVREYLEILPDRIHFYGKSLGGAVAVQTQALDPDNLVGAHVNERSFASLDKMIKTIFGFGCLGKFLGWIFNNLGYSADAAAAFRKLQGQKLVVYHPEDQIIPYSASLQNEVEHDAVICLQPKVGRWEGYTYADLSRCSHHNALLTWHEGATDQIGQFLFGVPGIQGQNAV